MEYLKYFKRFFICILGLALYALGNFFGVKAGVAGTNAWNTLALGLSDTVGIGFATSTLWISLGIILIDLLGKGKLGFGTVLNALLIPLFYDLYVVIFPFIPTASNVLVGTIYTLLGQTILSFATILYMLPALGCGPRDTLMVIIGQKFPNAPIGTVKFCLEMAVLLVGFLLGAPFGIGTVLVILLQASIFQFACKVTRYEPRSVQHEGLIETCRQIFHR